MIDYPIGIRSRIIKNINGLSMHILEAGSKKVLISLVLFYFMVFLS